MTLDITVAAEVRRLHFAEKWPINTVARQLGVHPDAVRRLVGLAMEGRRRPSRADLMAPYETFVRETLERFPDLRATRLFDMLGARGFLGSPRTVRRYVESVRPKHRGKTYVHPMPVMGEQAQVDWMHVGKLMVPGGQRDVWAFVMVLSHSRAMWAELLFDLSAFGVRRSLLRASMHFGGCTRQWLFDNPKTVVIARHGDAYKLHPLLQELCGALHVQARLCQVRRPQTKGRVERAVRYVRDRFLAGRVLRDIDTDNAALATFLAEIPPSRPHPEKPGVTVEDVFAEEKRHLLPLPSTPPPLEDAVPGRVDKYALVAFDGNRYSVPALHGSGSCTVVFDDANVRILIGTQEIARHRRCWGRRQVIEEFAHRPQSPRKGPASRACNAHARMRRANVNVDQLLCRWVERGCNMGSMTSRAVKILDLYGDTIFAEAVNTLLDTDLFETAALAHLCDQIRARRGRHIPVAIDLPAHVIDTDVQQHDLEGYDAI